MGFWHKIAGKTGTIRIAKTTPDSTNTTSRSHVIGTNNITTMLPLDLESRTGCLVTRNHSYGRVMYFLATYVGRSIRYRVIFIASYLLLRATTDTPRSEDMWFNLITDTGFKTSSTSR